MARRRAGAARVVPILVRAVDLTGTPFEPLARLPDQGAVTSAANADEVWTQVTCGIRSLLASSPPAGVPGPEERTPRPGPKIPAATAYLAALEREIRFQPLGLDQDGASLRLLEDVYVELRAADRRGLAGAGRMPFDGGPQPLERFLELAAPHCFSVLGEPGSGKSTLLKHLALAPAERARRALEAGRDPGAAAVPVLIRLADLDVAGEGPFDHLERTRGQLGLPQGIGAALRAQAAAGRVLFLLDGLDEVPAARLGSLLAQVRRVAGERAWLDAGCRVVVTGNGRRRSRCWPASRARRRGSCASWPR